MRATRNMCEGMPSTNECRRFLTVRHEIPQIDVSRQLPNYPGMQSPVFGLRTEVVEIPGKCSPYKQVDLLFRASNFAESLATAVLLRPTRYTPEELPQRFVEVPYPIQTVQLNQSQLLQVLQSRIGEALALQKLSASIQGNGRPGLHKSTGEVVLVWEFS